MEFIHKIALLLVIIGGLNWGLVGLADFDLIAFLFGQMSWFSRIIYDLIGLSALWLIIAPFIHEHKNA